MKLQRPFKLPSSTGKKATLLLLTRQLRHWRNFLVNLTVILLLITSALFISVIIYKEVRKESLLIHPFLVSGELKNKGYTGDWISRKLIHQSLFIKNQATTVMQRKSIIETWEGEQIEVKVHEVEFSLTSLIESLRDFTGRQVRIHGEATIDNGLLVVTIHLSSDIVFENSRSYLKDGLSKTFDTLLFASAERLYQETQPYLLASYYHAKNDKQSCLNMVRYCLLHAPPEDDHWALNLWGVVLNDQEDLDGSIEKYNAALETAQKLKKKFPIAYANRGQAYYQKGDMTAL